MAKRALRRKARPNGKLKSQILGALIKKHPKVLEVLDKHGVTFCAGCYLTLFSPLDRVAAYHAVPDFKKFLADLNRAI